MSHDLTGILFILLSRFLAQLLVCNNSCELEKVFLQEIGDQQKIKNDYEYIGRCHFCSGDHEKGQKTLNWYFEIAHETGAVYSDSDMECMNMLGCCYTSLGQGEKAVKSHSEFLAQVCIYVYMVVSACVCRAVCVCVSVLVGESVYTSTELRFCKPSERPGRLDTKGTSS